MGRISSQQNTFSGGEFSAVMFGRQDIEKYKSALQTCYNALLLVQGGWTRRPGTLRLLNTRNSGTNGAALIPFTYSNIQTYVLEFGNLYVRFYSGHGVVTEATQAITNVTNANPGVVTYSGADTYANGDRVYISDLDTTGIHQLNNREFTVRNVNTTANTFELEDELGTAVNTSNYGVYAGSGTVAEIIQVTTPYAAADVADIRYLQSADTLYLFHPSYKPRKLVRTSALSWTLSTISFVDGPYLPINATTTTMTPSGTTGSVTITASSTTGINNDTGFQTTDVGRLIRLRTGTSWGWGTITARASTTSITVTVGTGSTFTDTSAKVSWRLGLWSDTTGYPSCGTFYEDRLILGGSTIAPQRFDGSKTGNYETFSPTTSTGAVPDDSAISFTLNSADVNPIYWMINNIKALLIGTGGSEWQVKASALNEALTPSNISAKRMSSYGSENVAPVTADTATLYTQKAGRKIREMAYDFQADTFLAPDMTLLSDHVTTGGVIKMVMQRQPQPIIWCLLGNGSLATLTYSRDQGVTGWTRHDIAGIGDVNSGLPTVVDIAVQVAPDGTRDEIWMIVERYVNGHTRRSVEVLTKMWDTTDDQTSSFYADYGWSQINASPSASVTGLYWAEGETFGILADGAAHAPKTVTNGKITLDYAATVVTVGYHYNSDGADMPSDANSPDGSGQTKMKKLGRVGFWLLDTLGLYYGPTLTKLTPLITALWGREYGVMAPLRTGIVRERLESDFDRLGNTAWRANGPFPATVLSLISQTTVSDDS